MRRGLQIQNLASFVPLTQKQQRGGGIEKERIRQIFADLFANRFSTIAFQTPANHHPPKKQIRYFYLSILSKQTKEQTKIL